MRFTIVALAILMAFTAGCGSEKPAAPAAKEAPQRVSLITTLAGDAVTLDPATVKVNGLEVSLTLHFVKKEIKDGVKSEAWEATFKPSERLLAIKATRLYDSSGKELSADTAPAGWEYIAPASDSERLMFAVSEYCRSRGLALNDTPPPYALPGFMYIAKSTANESHYLYKPASVRARGGTTSVEVLMVSEVVKNGAKYSLATVTFRPGERQYQTTAQTLYDAGGKQLSIHNDPKWYAVPPNSVFDMLLDKIR